MSTSKTATKQGLEGINAADSAISAIDGRIGELSYRGYRIKDLAEHSTFAETVWLLLEGELPDAAEGESFREEVTRHTLLHEDFKRFYGSLPKNAHPMPTLAAAVVHSRNPINESGYLTIEDLGAYRER